jgi:hypothetical protein
VSAAERRTRLAQRRVRRTVLFLALASAICASTVGLAAPRRKGRAARPKADAAASSTAADAGARAPAASAAGTTTTTLADGGTVVATTTTTDGGAKVFRFGELEIEGRLKSPQLVYFLRRVRAEFSAGDLGHRSFFPELSQTKDDPNF